MAIAFADWISTENNIDDLNIRKQWSYALSMPPQINPFTTNEMEKSLDVNSLSSEKNKKVLSGKEKNGNRSNNNSPVVTPPVTNEVKTPKTTKELPGNKNLSPSSANDDAFENETTKENPSCNGQSKIKMRKKKKQNSSLEIAEKQALQISNNHSPRLAQPHSPSPPSTPSSPMEKNNRRQNISPSYSPKLSPRIGPQSSAEDSDINSPRTVGHCAETKDFFEELSTEQKAFLCANMPLLSEITSSDKRDDVFVSKLKLCCVVFDFKSTNVWQFKGIQKKKVMLTEILEYVSKYEWYSEPMLQHLMVMINKNLFNPLCRCNKIFQGADDESPEDSAWLHLQLIYDLVLYLVMCPNVDKKIMRRHLEGKFINNVIELFISEDPRERECLKTILHRVYGRFMSMRLSIRASIANMCYRTIYDDRPENGIPEFLEIFCSIIHGFTVPVKKEHKQFLRTVLIPLHKCPHLERFHEQLVACCVRFVFKDPSIGPIVLSGLLRFWPIQSPPKEEMFIAEVANVIHAMINDNNAFRIQPHQHIILAVVDQLVKCMKSKHHCVAERAIMIWSEEAMEILVDLDKVNIWPKIVGAFIENKTHWNEELQEINEDAMIGFKRRDEKTFSKIMEDYFKTKALSNGNQKIINDKKKRKQQQWAVIRTLAAQRSSQKMFK